MLESAVRVAIADGVCDEEERRVLASVAEALGVSTHEMKLAVGRGTDAAAAQ